MPVLLRLGIVLREEGTDLHMLQLRYRRLVKPAR